MTSIAESLVPASSADLPPVERRAAMPAGFRAGGRAAGIKASGRPDLAVIVTTAGPPAAADAGGAPAALQLPLHRGLGARDAEGDVVHRPHPAEALGQGTAGALVNDARLYEDIRDLIARMNNLVILYKVLGGGA